ncbi:probable G-protein coupled receptor Mth-like 5 [Osmia bicornis bicornis]|uniref:probable G-protein coupled receptor Mth-like 5 n=1 Tax=Osmia bicornis bicornis TaxID=1437191 RepID=UPI0010F9ADF5|nr:probable G-protein coupled receptor Mth-like 5 [Osmia bicornis bicornis]XP_046144784.1 probable G-protein coupled receptor Mth-like 5 [Osmia bicornis bicornis]
MYHLVSTLLIIGTLGANHPRIVLASNNGELNLISVAKCCEPEELLVDDTCTPLTETNETEWRPEFVEEKVNGISRSRPVKPNYQLKIGRPKCQSNEHQWNVYHYQSGEDRLAILTTGVLRHYTRHLTKGNYNHGYLYGLDAVGLDEDDEDDLEAISNHHDYSFGHYCIDKAVLSRDRLVATYAMVCVPNVVVGWTDTDYLMKHGIDPTFHAISIASYLVVAVVYFVLPQLRDLVGNMITSMTLCLIAGQSASMVRIFTEFGNHVSFMVADTVMYVSLLAAFFWLNALGYYVWSTFRSRNVFLRVTDGRKYCYYSSYVWGSTVCIAGTAIFAHFALETNKPMVGGTLYPPQETIGWLGISMFFTSIAFTIIIDLCFVLTTANRIKRMSTYGRIHHKMKYSFRMFVFLFIIMSTGWLSLLLSRLNYNALLYCHIVINILQAIFILYVCVFGQRRVTFLLGKTCNCCNSEDNIEGLDWGEEMTAINAGY